ncbi:hypothetical protein HZH68_008939 [Vespula germanica]|uniref:Uncharacterized protein n=1 Tax=Vespula germanica TaxID=30212 RepID=A0A834K097_VESGE|nr:hypothetical protein HZH68_008939 [Vespula germanica]
MAAAGKASEAREGGSLKRRELPSNGVAPFVGRILLYTIKAAFQSFDFATRHIWLNDDKLISCGLGPARGLVQDCPKKFQSYRTEQQAALGIEGFERRSRKELSVSRTAPLSLWKDRGCQE